MDAEAIHVLLVEDNPGDADRVHRVLGESTDARFRLVKVETLSAALEQLSEAAVDVVLLDLGLPDSQGLDTFTRMHSAFPDLPIVVLTGPEDEANAAQAVQRGAQDYLAKSELGSALLGRAVAYAIERKRMEIKLAQHRHELERLTQERASEIKHITDELARLVTERSQAEKERRRLEERAGEIMKLNDELAKQVAERIQAEAELTRLKEFNENIIQSVSETIVLEDEAGYITFVNPAAAKLLGYQPGELRGTHWTAIVPPDQYATIEAVDERRKRGVVDRYEVEVLHKDGTRRYVLVSGNPRYEDGEFVGTMAVFTDITALKQAELELRKLSRAVEQSPASVVITDTEGNIEYVNPKFTQVTGYTLEEVVGQNPRILKTGFTPAEEYERLWKTIKAGEEWRGEFHNRKKNGEVFWEWASISSVIDEEGHVTHFLAVKEDITERKEAEARVREMQTMLMHSEKMNALGQLVAGVAHEINNPVAFVNSNIHSLRMALADIAAAYNRLESVLQKEGTTAQKESAKAIRQEADLDFTFEDSEDLLASSVDGLARVTKIVQGLRTFSRLDEAERKVTNLVENIASTLALAGGRLKRNVEVILEIDELPDIMCYPAELNQAFLNIIINAAQAIKDKGTLTIRGRDEGEHIVLEFEDTGVGMAPEIMRDIFNPFFTTKPVGEGTGLGLAIAHTIITDHHQGTIHVESTPGEGTTFTIRLPKEIDL